ncbi:hypothetical protein O181_035335 [Austropuccinia psidii MF-1]|uniref:Uncharacterized protein n=1 Tax=Austropuccinia psidii MF-1 TaxID=1389203 RepID=A0A9Q3D6P4_9BASI|nr:hypothetical protein [Austropuccinia psidii MF-1]
MRAKLDRVTILEVASPSWKEGRVPIRSSSFSGVAGRFPGTSSTTFKGPGEDGEEEEENSVEDEDSDGTGVIPAPVGHLKILEGQLYCSLLSMSVINPNHLYWQLCSRCLELWQIFKQIHPLPLQDCIYEGTRLL